MKRSALLLLLLVFLLNYHSWAQDKEVSTAHNEKPTITVDSTEARQPSSEGDQDKSSPESSADDQTAENQENPVENKEKSFECVDAYLNYAKGLSKSKQKDEFEVWWDFSDYDYRSVKNDEFKFKEEKVKWLKKYDEALAKPVDTYYIHPKVKLGQYDFKKKGFPVEINLEKPENTIVNQYEGGFSMSSGIGGTTSDKAYCSNSSLNREKDIPTTVGLKLINLDKLKFLSVPEEKAKLVTASLGSSRIVTLKLKVVPVKTSKSIRKMGSMKFTHMVSELKVQEVFIDAGEEELSFKY
ncbi:MAG: DUF4852 domain-containing protein [Pseudobdellovibrio sp.]